MNSEVLETSKNECYVIGDDAKVRRLTKVNNDDVFRNFLQVENEIEEKKKERNVVEKKYNKAKGHYFLVWGIAIALVFLLKAGFSVIGYFGHDILLNVTLTELKDILVALSLFSVSMAFAYTVATPIGNFFLKRSLKKYYNKLSDDIYNLNTRLASLKYNNDVKEEVLSNDTISDETINKFNEIYKEDPKTMKIVEENNYRVLRQFQRECQSYTTDEEEKGFTYSLRR